MIFRDIKTFAVTSSVGAMFAMGKSLVSAAGGIVENSLLAVFSARNVSQLITRVGESLRLHVPAAAHHRDLPAIKAGERGAAGG